jgi:hypothetical protein
MKRTATFSLLASFAVAFLPSCATPMTEAEKAEAAERRIKHATQHIRQVNRGRPGRGG